jgi:alpha-tubulin suppressor-like RCC1 family protein
MTSRVSFAGIALLLGLLSSSVAEATSARLVASGEYFTCALTIAGGVKCWGDNGHGQLGDGTTTTRTTPVDVIGLTGGVVSLSAGRSFACAVTVDGLVRCWGDGSEGQLGNGAQVGSSTPTTVAGISGAVQVAAGFSHACALTSAGGVKCWGKNSEGEVGRGNTTSPVLSPADATGLTSGVRSVVANSWHTCAVTTSGGAKCWGDNSVGTIGDGTTTDRSVPTDVQGLTGGVVALASAEFSNCALTTAGGMKCWGFNGFGQLGDGSTDGHLAPVDVSGLTGGVAAPGTGFLHTCAVLSNGGLDCWGSNEFGQLGDGTTADRAVPAGVPATGWEVSAVSGGSVHTCAVLTNGMVRCWGDNSLGQLGDGTTVARLTPVTVSGLSGGDAPVAHGVASVSTGAGHSCTLTTAGGVECWGRNASGQLGDGTVTNRSTPVPVAGLSTGVVFVAAGDTHTCALTVAGGIKCWGDNSYGALGDGTTTSRSAPVDVAGLTSGVARVAAGASFTCAVTTSGGLKCWGRNQAGNLGDGTTANRAAPVNVTGLTTGVASVSTGSLHACAVSTTGGLTCWGSNAKGQLGDGTTNDALTSVSVSGLGSGIASVTAGYASTCALTTGGGVKCWGANAAGELGDGTTTERHAPVDVSGLTSGVASLEYGAHHGCALVGGRVKCWGSNGSGGLGNGTTTNGPLPVDVTGLRVGAASVSAGLDDTCAVSSRGGLQCWGDNTYGQVGDGTSVSRLTPRWVVGHLAGAGGLLALGDSHGCRVTRAGSVQCWGLNANGQLGDGTTTNRRTPVDVAGLSSGIVAVSTGSSHSCALTSIGAVLCWGANSAGQLGDGTTTDQATPVEVVGMVAGAVALAGGAEHTCALMVSGAAWCWGRNDEGQLGNGTTVSGTAVQVTALPGMVRDIAAGASHSCALTLTGGVFCWGGNGHGQLGDNTAASRSTPVPMLDATRGIQAFGAGAHHTCVLTDAGAVKCVGDNASGELGDGTQTTRSRLVQVTGLTSAVKALAVGGSHGCAVLASGAVQCWGRNQDGELGDGTAAASSVPVTVSGLAEDAGMPALGGAHACVATAADGIRCWGRGTEGQLGDGLTLGQLHPVVVRGFKQDDNYDSDQKADVAVYRPSTGTWFSLDSSAGNASFQSRGWGVQAQGDVPVPGDFDGDGIVDPTVFRASTGTWFVLKSSTGFTAYDYFGWGTTGDTPVPADYDGDGKTDGAVYRASTGTWYIRPSSGAGQWSVRFGNATDIPIPGHFDADGKADIAVYRPSTGTWFVLTSSSNYTDYWYRGWGIQAQGDSPAPGDYDGDGKLDLCVFRASTGTWFVLESHTNYTTMAYFGWGATGDTLVPADYDGDGITDAAVYRPSTFTWYIRPSGGGVQWSTVFGASGDVPLITIR